jgi:hypothetical protein
MSYHYEDDVRGYDDGQGNYGNEHDTYSDHAKPDHYSHEDDDHGFEHEAPEYEVAGEVHGQKEIKYEVYEHEGLECEGGEMYEHEELVYGPEHGDVEQEYEDGIDERERLETGNNEVYELRELEHEPQEPYELEYEPERSDSDTHYGIHEPRTLESSGVPQRAEPKYEGPGRHTHAHHYPTPTHVPHPRDIPHLNQRGRTTTLKDVQHRVSPYPTLRHPPTHTPPIEPAHGTAPTLSITQSHPPPWPNDTHNTHLPQSRPPPWPD